MQKLDLKAVPKSLKPNPIFKGLPTSLKDPKMYAKIEKQLFEVLKGDHNHKTAKAYVRCVDCNSRREERKKIMKDIGFKSLNQYMEWKKIMNIINNKKSFQLQ